MNQEFQRLYASDLKRYGGSLPRTEQYLKRFHRYLRAAQTAKNPIMRVFWRILHRRHCEKNGIEISWRIPIGKGFCVSHPYGITISTNAVVGENVSVHKGVTIGQENRGSRIGAPVIGNRVWIGINATVVGAIHIGDDVMIAPNAFVNFDVPDHSVVVGNPAVIHPRMYATEGYIVNLAD